MPPWDKDPQPSASWAAQPGGSLPRSVDVMQVFAFMSFVSFGAGWARADPPMARVAVLGRAEMRG
jgi:hypothetical protein